MLPSTGKISEAKIVATEFIVCLKIINRGNLFNVHITTHNPFDEPINIDMAKASWVLPPGIEIKNPSNEKGFDLQPGDSHSITFQLKTLGLLDILPAIPWRKKSYDDLVKIGEHFISLNIPYVKSGVTHWQEVRASFNIHAAPIEVYVSAIIGAIVGSLIRKPVFGLETIASGVLGFFLVLIAKRRTDVQLGFTVEDWIGGIIIGFSVGYLGTSYFENFLPKPSP